MDVTSLGIVISVSPEFLNANLPKLVIVFGRIIVFNFEHSVNIASEIVDIPPNVTFDKSIQNAKQLDPILETVDGIVRSFIEDL